MLSKSAFLLEDIVLLKNPRLTEKVLEQSNFRCNSEMIVVKHAMEAGNIENLRVLLHHGRGWKTRRAIFEREIIQQICFDPTSVKFIVEQLPNLNVIDEHFLTSLRMLFEQGTHDVVRVLLECKIDSYVKDKFETELLVNIFGNSKVNVIELFENRALDVHAQDVSGETALHSAVMNDIVKNVRFLLDHGANPNSKDCVGWTPLFVVKSIECMELLLDYGGDLQSIDKDGYTILESSTDIIAQAVLANLAIEEVCGTTTIRQEIYDKIDSNDTFQDFYDNCHREIESMKNQIIFGNNNLFTIMCDNTEKVLHDNHELISQIINNQTSSSYGYVYSMLEKKLKRNLDTHRDMLLIHKAPVVTVRNNDIFDPYNSIAEKIVNHSIVEDLLVFLLILFNSIRIFF